MNYDELIKALTTCGSNNSCEGCQFYDGNEYGLGCLQDMIKDAADAIEALQSELSKMREENAAALTAQAERENPQPLSLEQLRERDGKPVWMTSINGTGGVWGLINIPPEKVYMPYAVATHGTKRWFQSYGKTWLAYDTEVHHER